MATEATKVNAVLKAGLYAGFPAMHWQRVECWSDRGVPDVNFCIEGVEYWLECKWVPTRKGANFSHKLQPEQCAWLLSRSRAGGRAGVLARRENVFRVYPASEARSVVDRGWEGRYALEMEKPWDWRKMVSVLM